MNRNDFIRKRLKEHYCELENSGFEIVGLFLQGSQNYDMDIYNKNYKSDIDTKAIVLPRLEDIINNIKPYSSTHIMENDEHIDIKDIRIMFEMFEKQNINYLEILYTDFFIINPKYEKLWNIVIENKNSISNIDNKKGINAIYGALMNKYKALEHPYPKTKDKIDKYGYDPKQLHHIYRFYLMLKEFIKNKTLEEYLTFDNENKKYLLDLKLGKYSLEEARNISKYCVDNSKQIKEDYLTNGEVKFNYNAIKILNDVKTKIIKKYFIENLGEFKENEF